MMKLVSYCLKISIGCCLLVYTAISSMTYAEQVLTPAPLPAEISFNEVSPLNTKQAISGQLTLGDFIQHVKHNHPALKMARIDQDIASAKRLETQGAFDPSINGGSSYNRFNSSSAVGKVQEAIDNAYTVDLLTRYGIELSAGTKLLSGDAKTPFSPTGETGEYFGSVKLPLLRGAGINPKAAREKKALLNEPVSVNLYRTTELALLKNGINQYWQWVASFRQVGVEEALLKLAKARADLIDSWVEAGDAPAIDSVEANREVQKRLGRLAKASRFFQESTFKLGLYLWDATGDRLKLPEEKNVPAGLPTAEPLEENDIATAKLIALENRPELKVLNLSKEMARVDRKLAKNNLLPKIDAFLTQGVETGKNSINGPVMQAGLSVSLPLRQRTAKGQIKQAELALEKLDVQERQMIEAIFIEISDAASAVNMAYEQYSAAVEELELSQRLEQGERTKFDYGDSTLFLVNQRERSTAEANINVIEALNKYLVSLAKFQVASGEI